MQRGVTSSLFSKLKEEPKISQNACQSKKCLKQAFKEKARRNVSTLTCKNGQATKSTRGMPWHREPMKDVTNCDKPRGAVSERYIRGFPNGAIRQEESLVIIC